MMEQRTEENLSPYRTFSRAEWAMLREDTPMTLSSEEVTRLRSLHDRLDMAEVEEIYLPLSRLLSMYVAATQRLFRAQERFLGTTDGWAKSYYDRNDLHCVDRELFGQRQAAVI